MEVGLAFGKVLRKRRVEAGFTQEQLAHEAELQRNYVSLMERVINQPTITTFIKLANPLGCTAADIVDDVERLVADQRLNRPPKPINVGNIREGISEDCGLRVGGLRIAGLLSLAPAALYRVLSSPLLDSALNLYLWQVLLLETSSLLHQQIPIEIRFVSQQTRWGRLQSFCRLDDCAHR